MLIKMSYFFSVCAFIAFGELWKEYCCFCKKHGKKGNCIIMVITNYFPSKYRLNFTLMKNEITFAVSQPYNFPHFYMSTYVHGWHIVCT